MLKIIHKNIIICSIFWSSNYSIILYNKCVDVEKQSETSLRGWGAEEFRDPYLCYFLSNLWPALKCCYGLINEALSTLLIKESNVPIVKAIFNGFLFVSEWLYSTYK